MVESNPLPEWLFQRDGEKCCERCDVERQPKRARRFMVCSICGNKRCPHASDHRHECTNNNAPGQPGSNYQ